MKEIRILIADDHSLVRVGLASLLGAKAGFAVVGEATNGKEAVDAAKKLKPDVVVMDLMMPVCNGADAAAAIHDAAPEVKIMILTTFGAANDIARALRNGATGAVMKSMTNDELVDAIRRVAAGERVVSPEIERIHSSGVVREAMENTFSVSQSRIFVSSPARTAASTSKSFSMVRRIWTP